MNSENSIKKLPFSLEAEQSVLGSILIDPEKISDIASTISTTDFYLEEHQEIFSAMQKLFLQSKDIDSVLLAEELVHEGIYDIDKSKSYIKTLADIVPSSSNIKDYALIVKDKSLLRQLIEICSDISNSAYSEQDDVSFIIDNAGSRIFSLAQTKQQTDFWHIRDVLIETYRNIKELSENNGNNGTLQTGFSGVDRVLVGMGKGDLVIVGARPGMGKTSFAVNIGVDVARRTQKQVCIFSLEMSKEQIVERMLSSEALVESTTLRKGNLQPEDWTKLAKASAYLSECEIYIDDTSGITITGMKAKLRKMKNLGLVIIDYLQLMHSEKRIDNRVQEVSDISRNLKLMAKDLGVPIVCCAQLSRGTEGRTDKLPMLSDLRDSGAIEQDADVVMFLYRDKYYDTQDTADQNTAQVIIAKNRHGGTDNVKLGWFGQYTKFTTVDERDEPD